MVIIEKEKLIIEMKHISPDEVLKDIQLDIITCLQNQSDDPPEKPRSYFLLELLKHTMDLEL